jgi:IclR family KDG regulon transcriptional repressor
MKPPANSFQKAIDVLEAFDAQTPLLGVTDLSRRLELPKSTVQRIINNLGHRGLVEQDSATSKYRLGIKLFELGARARRQMDLPERAKPHLQTLTAAGGETSTLAILYGHEALYIERVESSRVLRASALGSRMPLHCTAVGKILLTAMSDSEFDVIIKAAGMTPRTAKSITNVGTLKEHIVQARKDGYVVDHEEYEDGLVCIAAPVFNYATDLVAAVGLSAPLMRARGDNLRDLIAAVVSAARAMSIEMGYPLAPNGG